MAQYIIHKNGAYNIYGTIADGPYFNEAMTLGDLNEYVIKSLAPHGINELPARLERAHLTGCSALHGWTLEECISGNRAGPNETELSVSKFVEKYLTLRSESVGASKPVAIEKQAEI